MKDKSGRLTLKVKAKGKISVTDVGVEAAKKKKAPAALDDITWKIFAKRKHSLKLHEGYKMAEGRGEPKGGLPARWPQSCSAVDEAPHRAVGQGRLKLHGARGVGRARRVARLGARAPRGELGF